MQSSGKETQKRHRVSLSIREICYYHTKYHYTISFIESFGQRKYNWLVKCHTTTAKQNKSSRRINTINIFTTNDTYQSQQQLQQQTVLLRIRYYYGSINHFKPNTMIHYLLYVFKSIRQVKSTNNMLKHLLYYEYIRNNRHNSTILYTNTK